MKEKWYLQRFKDACDDFPIGAIEDFENPDFLVANDNVTIGIEITQLFRPVNLGQLPMQEVESWQRRIHEEAKITYEANGGAYLYVNVIFNERTNRKKSSVKTLAKQLSEIVAVSNPSVGDDFRLENPYTDFSAFPEEFAVVFIKYYEKATTSLWAPIDSAFVPDLHPNLLQQRIDEKNKRLLQYRKSCQIVWLLIVLDGSELSSHMNLRNELIDHTFSSQFERTYLFVSSDSKFIRLNQA